MKAQGSTPNYSAMVTIDELQDRLSRHGTVHGVAIVVLTAKELEALLEVARAGYVVLANQPLADQDTFDGQRLQKALANVGLWEK